ncbi:ribosomal protein S1 [Pirellula staleyi DSM 6068]|uniref:Small ribosomal subunit protein bS1 n=1 Tax=Pirellula staleyi (strain ATCC 27377 / DSM 6068 / ICPB 4128) TaxID=530564 RepID=D2R4L6_PIRSD|nr:30S ribosomal protein S1 [Pirellula staleyi]ADB17082.1 ribosomal protein S1 [Pirellula staleyi DSM 6068]
MVDRSLIRLLENDPDITAMFESAIADFEEQGLDPVDGGGEFDVNKIVEGRVLRVADGMVLVDIGFKSEGSIPLDEWEEGEEPPQVGQLVRVLIEDLEDETAAPEDGGMVRISKRKAKKLDAWKEMMDRIKEGQVVTGTVSRKIKGGLLVDIEGVNVFLPASQVDIRRPADIGDYIGRTVQCEVLKIDEARRNIVVSRRSLIERQREEDREALLKELEIGQVRKGVVKNIAEFGAFVDLGGIDGLLHITDMSWERIGHPSEMVAIDQEIEVMVLHIDREKKKIALGLKQKEGNPWADVDTKYPVGTVVKGSVVNVMSYGAFVKLEPGIEGLVHISEMSWTRRVNHPSELVNIGDEISVVILGVDKDGQQLSLGMKQTQENPWTRVAEKYPVDTIVEGKVRNLTNYGAFVELEEGIDGLLHVSDMSWTRKISHPSEMLEKGQPVRCKILSVDQERRRIALGLKQLDEDPWARDIPGKYQPGQVVSGAVTKITNFGVFVGLEDGLEGLLHISELADHKVENPEDVVKVGDKIDVKILRVDIDERKIGLSRKRVEWAEDETAAAEAAEAAAAAPAADKKKARSELKGGLGGSGPLIAPPTGEEA